MTTLTLSAVVYVKSIIYKHMSLCHCPCAVQIRLVLLICSYLADSLSFHKLTNMFCSCCDSGTENKLCYARLQVTGETFCNGAKVQCHMTNCCGHL